MDGNQWGIILSVLIIFANPNLYVQWKSPILKLISVWQRKWNILSCIIGEKLMYTNYRSSNSNLTHFDSLECSTCFFVHTSETTVTWTVLEKLLINIFWTIILEGCWLDNLFHPLSIVISTYHRWFRGDCWGYLKRTTQKFTVRKFLFGWNDIVWLDLISKAYQGIQRINIFYNSFCNLTILRFNSL